MADITQDGQLVDKDDVSTNEPSKEVAKMDTEAQQVVSYNPLDANPVAFEKNLANRQDNYDALQLHLQGVLIAGKDFGKIHVQPKCDNKYTCTNDYHFSGYQLFAPGADKILGILGLGVHYPDLKDYKRAPLRGIRVEDVILECHILGHGEQVIAQGAGACSRDEMKGDLNRTIKRACKRARLDAVLRLPVVNALFEDGFLEQMAEAQVAKKQRTAASRAQKIKNIWDTGATLHVCPIGETTTGKPWHEVPTEALQWMVAKLEDKPDIHRAANRELLLRNSAPESSSVRNGASPDSTDE